MKTTSVLCGGLAALALLNAAPALAQIANPAPTVNFLLGPYEGWDTLSSPIQALDGLIYDVGGDQDDDYGGVYNWGLGPNGTQHWNTGYVFGDSTDGGLPVGGTVQGPNGTLYGTTGLGGTYNQGVLWNLTGNFTTTRGTETPIYAFAGTN